MWLQKGTNVVDAEIATRGTSFDLSSGWLALTQLDLHGAVDGAGEEVAGGIPPQTAREERRSSCIKAAQSRDRWKGRGGADAGIEVHMRRSDK